MEGDEAEAEFLAEHFAEVEFVLCCAEEEAFWIFGQIFLCDLKLDEDDLVEPCFNHLLRKHLADISRDIDHIERSGEFVGKAEQVEDVFPRRAIDIEESSFVSLQILDAFLFGSIVGERDCERMVRHQSSPPKSRSSEILSSRVSAKVAMFVSERLRSPRSIMPM